MAEILKFQSSGQRLRRGLEPLGARLAEVLGPIFFTHQIVDVSLIEMIHLMIDILERDGFDPDPDVLAMVVNDPEQIRRIAGSFLAQLAARGLVPGHLRDVIV